MGRQVAFYMAAADEEEFYRFIRDRGDIAVLPDDYSHSGFPELPSLPVPESGEGWYTLNLAPRSAMDRIRYLPVKENLFIIDKDASPIVEWARSIRRGSRLKEGRFWIGGTPAQRHEQATALYEDLQKWLKRHCTRMKKGRFFIGRSAKAWAAGGGDLIFGQDPWEYPKSRFELIEL